MQKTSLPPPLPTGTSSTGTKDSSLTFSLTPASSGSLSPGDIVPCASFTLLIATGTLVQAATFFLQPSEILSSFLYSVLHTATQVTFRKQNKLYISSPASSLLTAHCSLPAPRCSWSDDPNHKPASCGTAAAHLHLPLETHRDPLDPATWASSTHQASELSSLHPQCTSFPYSIPFRVVSSH